MRRQILFTGVAVASLTLGFAEAQTARFEGRLSVVPIDPQTAPDVTGVGRVTAELRGRNLSISGEFEGLQGPATEARLHSGIATGVRGEPLAELAVQGDTAGTITAEVQLTTEQVDALRAGRMYVQLHSDRAPDGNLWGWLLP